MTFKPHGNKRKGWLLPSNKEGVTHLRRLRVERGIPSYEAAKLCGISPGHYSSVENAQREVTDLVLPKLEAFLIDLGIDSQTKDVILR